MSATLPRVVLVEDDPAMRLYVETALRDVDVELVFCASVAEAMAALAGDPAHLLITDLMLPGRSGIELIESVRADPMRWGRPLIVVASAAIDAQGVRPRLGELGVWRALQKPVPLDVLESCVVEALRLSDASGARRPPTVAAPTESGASRPGAVDAFFGGDRALYTAYRAACVRQFDGDIAQGDDGAATQDAPGLRRLGHTLRSVLTSLGEESAAAAARSLEERALAADMPSARAAWAALREALIRLRHDG